LKTQLAQYVNGNLPFGRLAGKYAFKLLIEVAIELGTGLDVRTITALRSLCLVRKSRLGLHRLIT